MRKKMNWKTLLRRYADGGAGPANNLDNNVDGDVKGDENGAGDVTHIDNTGASKTFTQAEVNTMMSKEKLQGKLAVLKELGIDDVKTAKEGIAKYNEWFESQKTDLQKANDSIAAEKLAKEALAKQNATLQFKIDAISLGVKTECLDAIAAIVAINTVDGSDPKEVLKTLKEKPEYKGFFADGSGNDSSGGTGASIGSKKVPPIVPEGLGKRLGTDAAKDSGKKSSYFSS